MSTTVHRDYVCSQNILGMWVLVAYVSLKNDTSKVVLRQGRVVLNDDGKTFDINNICWDDESVFK